MTLSEGGITLCVEGPQLWLEDGSRGQRVDAGSGQRRMG